MVWRIICENIYCQNALRIFLCITFYPFVEVPTHINNKLARLTLCRKLCLSHQQFDCALYVGPGTFTGISLIL